MRKWNAVFPLTLVVGLSAAVLASSAATVACGQQSSETHPRDHAIHDADTRAWWHTTEALSGDDMEGRDTGTAAYQRAADYVAARFQGAGLEPAGDGQSYFQSVPLHEIAVEREGTSFTIEREKGGVLPIDFLQQITINPAANLPELTEAALTFRGYCGKDAMQDIAGKIVVCFGTQRQGLPSGSERVANARAGGATGLINIDDPYFTIEPPRWPAAYARSVALDTMPAAAGAPLLMMRASDTIFAQLLRARGRMRQRCWRRVDKRSHWWRSISRRS